MITVETTTSALKPTGSSGFLIDRGPFCPGSQIDIAAFDLERDKILDWPVVYILANDGDAYVGQTTSAATRINQHGANEEKQNFETVNIIYHDEFNASVITDYEHRLIGLMHADGRYAWKWVSNPKGCNDPTVRDIVIDDIGLKWNCTYDNWVVKGADDPRIAHEVGCIHSTQGYDLSYAYVIIGDDLAYDPDTGTLVANKANYYDRNGKNTATQEELDQYIKNIYYVLLTRGILGTHVYAVNPVMRRYLSKYFPKTV